MHAITQHTSETKQLKTGDKYYLIYHKHPWLASNPCTGRSHWLFHEQSGLCICIAGQQVEETKLIFLLFFLFFIFCLPSCYSKFSAIQTESDHLYWLIDFISLQNISQTKNIYHLITRIMTKKIQLKIKVNLFDRYFALSVELMLTELYFTDRPRLFVFFTIRNNTFTLQQMKCKLTVLLTAG